MFSKYRATTVMKCIYVILVTVAFGFVVAAGKLILHIPDTLDSNNFSNIE